MHRREPNALKGDWRWVLGQGWQWFWQLPFHIHHRRPFLSLLSRHWSLQAGLSLHPPYSLAGDSPKDGMQVSTCFLPPAWGVRPLTRCPAHCFPSIPNGQNQPLFVNTIPFLPVGLPGGHSAHAGHSFSAPSSLYSSLIYSVPPLL